MSGSGDNPAPAEMEGILGQKQDYEAGGKKASMRSWNDYYSVLSGHLLCFYSDREAYHDRIEASPSLFLQNSRCDIDPEYTKRGHVFRLNLPDGAKILFQAGTQSEMEEWIRKINSAAGQTAGGGMEFQHNTDVNPAASSGDKLPPPPSYEEAQGFVNPQQPPSYTAPPGQMQQGYQGGTGYPPAAGYPAQPAPYPTQPQPYPGQQPGYGQPGYTAGAGTQYPYGTPGMPPPGPQYGPQGTAPGTQWVGQPGYNTGAYQQGPPGATNVYAYPNTTVVNDQSAQMRAIQRKRRIMVFVFVMIMVVVVIVVSTSVS